MITGFLAYTLRTHGMAWKTIGAHLGTTGQASLQGASRWAKANQLTWPLDVVRKQTDPDGVPVISLSFDPQSGDMIGGGLDFLDPSIPTESIQVENGPLIYRIPVALFLEKFQQSG